jgi:hypothetical protein
LTILGLLAGFVSPSAYAIPANGDFANGLAAWVMTGDGSVSQGHAVLGDGSARFGTQLWQAIALAPGAYTVEFDFNNQLSPTIPETEPFAFPDAFFAGLYFQSGPNPPNFDPSDPSTFSGAIALFDLEASGFTQFQGTVGASPLGQDWSRYSLAFNHSAGFVIPLFELIDLNFAASPDSLVLLDNVLIEPVIAPPTEPIPEPATLALVALGMSGVYHLRSLRRRCNSAPKRPV